MLLALLSGCSGAGSGPTKVVDGRRVPVLEPGGGCDDDGACAMSFRRAGTQFVLSEPLAPGYVPGQVVGVAPGASFWIAEARRIDGVDPDLAHAARRWHAPNATPADDSVDEGRWYLAISDRYLMMQDVAVDEQLAVCDAVDDGPAGPSTRQCRWRVRCIRERLGVPACASVHPLGGE